MNNPRLTNHRCREMPTWQLLFTLFYASRFSNLGLGTREGHMLSRWQRTTSYRASAYGTLLMQCWTPVKRWDGNSSRTSRVTIHSHLWESPLSAWLSHEYSVFPFWKPRWLMSYFPLWPICFVTLGQKIFVILCWSALLIVNLDNVNQMIGLEASWT